jgi:hypothetical protein
MLLGGMFGSLGVKKRQVHFRISFQKLKHEIVPERTGCQEREMDVGGRK